MIHFSTNFTTEKVWLLEWVNHVPKLSKIEARKFQSGHNLGESCGNFKVNFQISPMYVSQCILLLACNNILIY